MNKWYEKREEDSIVISSRVRLARNLAEYHFSGKMKEKEAQELTQSVRDRTAQLEGIDGMKYYSCNVNKLSELEKTSLKEWYIISDLLVGRQQETGLVLSEDEGISIMINEEDHIRIQSVAPGADLEEAYSRAEGVDDCLEELGYAYDDRYGYLTTSPLNAGTGMRASYLMFLPAITMTGKMQKLADEVGKYGVAIRGIPGEGTNTHAYLYRISNQKTLGCSEKEIMGNLRQIMNQIVSQEQKYRDYLCKVGADDIEDKVYRSYGVLRYAKRISTEDGLLLLAQLKLGRDLGMIPLKKNLSLYEQMMRIQPANLQKVCGKSMESKERAAYRGEYLNKLMAQGLTSSI